MWAIRTPRRQLCYCHLKAVPDKTQANGRGDVPIRFLLSTLKFEFLLFSSHLKMSKPTLNSWAIQNQIRPSHSCGLWLPCIAAGLRLPTERLLKELAWVVLLCPYNSELITAFDFCHSSPFSEFMIKKIAWKAHAILLSRELQLGTGGVGLNL